MPELQKNAQAVSMKLSNPIGLYSVYCILILGIVSVKSRTQFIGNLVP